MLSNSDPSEDDPENTFFDNLYKDFKIQKVSIYRSICSIAAKRRNVNELIITNY